MGQILIFRNFSWFGENIIFHVSVYNSVTHCSSEMRFPPLKRACNSARGRLFSAQEKVNWANGGELFKGCQSYRIDNPSGSCFRPKEKELRVETSLNRLLVVDLPRIDVNILNRNPISKAEFEPWTAEWRFYRS